jgi:hypothetical protein
MNKKFLLLLGALLLAMVAGLFLKTTVLKPAAGDTASATPVSPAAAVSTSPEVQKSSPSSSPLSAPVAVVAPAAVIAPAPESGINLRASADSQPFSASVADDKNGPALVPGEMVAVQVVSGGKSCSLTPDQVGAFPKVNIDARQQVSVTASWPDGQAGQKVVVAAEDGGQVGGSNHPLAFTLDDQRQVAFDFTAGNGPGIYRVTLRKGPDVKTIQFWAGAELALKQP